MLNNAQNILIMRYFATRLYHIWKFRISGLKLYGGFGIFTHFLYFTFISFGTVSVFYIFFTPSWSATVTLYVYYTILNPKWKEDIEIF